MIDAPKLPWRIHPGHASERPDSLVHALQGAITMGLSPSAMSQAYFDWAAHLANAPFHRLALMQAWRAHGVRAVAAMLGAQVIEPASNDRRFVGPDWQTQPFSAIYQQFLLLEDWWHQATAPQPGLSAHHQQIVAFAARQWLDVFSPSNFAWLNPQVIEAAWKQRGNNFVSGFHAYMDDLRTMLTGAPPADAPLRVGRDLAVTPGKVVMRNALVELIQYAATTARVHAEPVLIVPAWIMKYYILDLSPENSLIRYLVSQGFTVFTLSWRNPDASLRQTSFDDYRQLGPMAALDAIGAITGARKIHGCGYCLGGTLLAATGAAMAQSGDERLASMTLLAAQTDFTEPGELQLFVGEDQLAFLEDVMANQGYLDSRQMAGAFQLLRSNDLIWSRLINNYLLGRPQAPNDLMTWNDDGTRMPACMHGQYLRWFYLENRLATGHLEIDGRTVSLADIDVPFFVVATETDHVAPWRSVYKIHLLHPGEVTFVLTSGGHNAGIVSEPGHPHRHYRIATRPTEQRFIAADAWQAATLPQEGSWWPRWCQWLAEHNRSEQAPPPMGQASHYPILADAPGAYVLQH